MPDNIPEPNWYANPKHRAECAAGNFFGLTKGKKTETRAYKIDAFRIKKYYTYYIKQNRSKGAVCLVKYDMAPLNHLSDDRALGNSSWCHQKRKSKGSHTCASEKDDKGCCRSVVTDKAIYRVMKEKYANYMSNDFLTQCCHSYDTQLNEGMNRSVMKYIPTGTIVCWTSSLVTRVNITNGIQLLGNHFFWEQVMILLNLSVPV